MVRGEKCTPSHSSGNLTVMAWEKTAQELGKMSDKIAWHSPRTLRYYSNEGDMGICGVAVLMFFRCGDAVNKISTCGVAVISNPTVCDVYVFHTALFGEMKSSTVLGFLV